MKELQQEQLECLFNRLFHTYGSQHWWPAESPFEVMVGAILTQNTAWSNVEKAIINLKTANFLDPVTICKATHKKLAVLIKPSGYFNVKANRLKNLCHWLLDNGGFSDLIKYETITLRDSLLTINGIGYETADDILLYAFERPVFVIDTYTRRLFAKHGLITGNEKYESLRTHIENVLSPDVDLFNEYHALIVRHAKEKCSNQPECGHCAVEGPLVI